MNIPEKIFDELCAEFDVTRDEVARSNRRPRNVVRARQCIAYALKFKAGLSHEQVAGVMGNTTPERHTTALSQIARAVQRQRTEPDFDSDLARACRIAVEVLKAARAANDAEREARLAEDAA
jgi:chromosomal replication initiation ATPase DnaA